MTRSVIQRYYWSRKRSRRVTTDLGWVKINFQNMVPDNNEKQWLLAVEKMKRNKMTTNKGKEKKCERWMSKERREENASSMEWELSFFFSSFSDRFFTNRRPKAIEFDCINICTSVWRFTIVFVSTGISLSSNVVALLKDETIEDLIKKYQLIFSAKSIGAW